MYIILEIIAYWSNTDQCNLIFSDFQWKFNRKQNPKILKTLFSVNFFFENFKSRAKKSTSKDHYNTGRCRCSPNRNGRRPAQCYLHRGIIRVIYRFARQITSKFSAQKNIGSGVFLFNLWNINFALQCLEMYMKVGNTLQRVFDDINSNGTCRYEKIA